MSAGGGWTERSVSRGGEVSHDVVDIMEKDLRFRQQDKVRMMDRINNVFQVEVVAFKTFYIPRETF